MSHVIFIPSLIHILIIQSFHFHFSSSSNYNSHRTVRQLSRKNLERQNTYYGDEPADEKSCETWSEMNYNSGYNQADSYSDYNQYDNNTGNIVDGANSFAKTLPQPPIGASQSTYDGFGYDR